MKTTLVFVSIFKGEKMISWTAVSKMPSVTSAGIRTLSSQHKGPETFFFYDGFYLEEYESLIRAR